MQTQARSDAPLAPLPLARRAARLRSSEIRDLLQVASAPGVLSLAGGLPAPTTFPVRRIEQAIRRAVAASGPAGPVALQYGPTEGLPELRELLAAGTPASPALGEPDAIIVTTGSQQGLDLLARVMVDPDDVVVLEDPAYLGARQVFEAAGAQVVGIPVDECGMDTEALARRLVGGLAPRIVALVPNTSNPSGRSLSPARRTHLAHLARRHGFVVVEDDAYHALGFAGPPPTPIGRLAPDRTVMLGSASKVIAPGLRVGWLRAPDWMVGALVRAKQTVDLHTATLPQLVVADLLADTVFMTEHLESVRATYRERAQTLHGALTGTVEACVPTGGMFLWGRTSVDTRTTFRAAIAAGVAYVPGDAFTLGLDGSAHLRLSFATLAGPDLERAAVRLRRVLDESPPVRPLP